MPWRTWSLAPAAWLLAALLAPGALAQDPGRWSAGEIDRVREEVKRSPTTPDNLRRRHLALMAWARRLLEEGADLGEAFSREDARDLEDLVRAGRFGEACGRVVAAYRRLEDLAERREKEREPIPARRVRIPVQGKRARAVRALPEEEAGADIREGPTFDEKTLSVRDGFVEVTVGEEPVWILVGTPPEERRLAPADSPFGFHPASVDGDYGLARKIGVDWDRGGFYFMWVLSQPDPRGRIRWEMYDSYFRGLPEGMQCLKNITVAHDGMVERPGRRPRPGRSRRRVDVSRHLEGTTYRPKDPEAYARWVRAAVERYDGDGVDDMPGLRTPAKFWQVDNEPPRGREGYPDLQRITYEAVKEADPEATVLAGGLKLPLPELRRAYEREDLPLLEALEGEAVDILDVHWFGHAGGWRDLAPAMSRLREDLARCGFVGLPIWITEMGTYAGTPRGRGRRLPPQSERAQAAEMVRRYATALGLGVKKVFWAWGMREGFMDPGDNDFFDSTGFVYDGRGPGDPGAGVEKLVYWSFGKMTELLRGWSGEAPGRVEAGEGVEAVRFPHGRGGGAVIAVWLSGPGKQAGKG